MEAHAPVDHESSVSASASANNFDGKCAPVETVEEISAKRRLVKESKGKLLVYVCDDHNEALNAIHQAIRIEAMPFESRTTMLHVDSHPDLMVPPDMPADLVFHPRDLQHHLSNSETGIAEFILPAVFAGHLSKVVWLRPPWADQIVDGMHTFFVGKSTLSPSQNITLENGEVVAGGPLRVSMRAPYYEDEGLYEDENTLLDKRLFKLEVSPDAERIPESFNADEGWILDICLDYFSVNNPFLVDLQQKLGKPEAELVRTVFAGYQLRWRRIEQQRMQVPDGVLKALQEEESRRLDSAIELAFNSEVHAEHASAEIAKCFTRDSDPSREIRDFIELVRNNTNESELIRSCGPNLDLPHHKSTDVEVAQMVSNLKAALLEMQRHGFKRPYIITIAKSSSDTYDYTPKDQVDHILNDVMGALEEIYDGGIQTIEYP